MEENRENLQSDHSGSLQGAWHIGERSGIYCSLRADQTDRHGCDPCGGGTGKVPAEMSVGRVK